MPDSQPPLPAGQASREQGAAPLRVLVVGDVYGSQGRRTFRQLVPGLRQELQLDFVIVNAENSAGGRGVTVRTARELRDAGADALTTGNHIWAQPDIEQALADDDLALIRPLNFPPDTPGRGARTMRVKGHEVTVVSLLGRVFMAPLDDPFRAMDTLLLMQAPGDGASRRPLVIVDFHAEATSEKQAMGWYLAGRVTAVVGTHTHVPTADTRLLPGGTAYVTDLGMVGPRDSIIGSAVEPTVHRFLSHRPGRAPVADGPAVFNAVLLELDPAAGTCQSICRIDHYDVAAGADRR